MIYITLVMYNNKMEDIPSKGTLSTFIKDYGNDKVKLIIVNNSDKSKFCELSDEAEYFVNDTAAVYMCEGKNLGLSKAYNKAFNKALSESMDTQKDFMMLLDDDTYISYDYLEMLYKAHVINGSKTKKVNVIASLVSSSGRPMSPIKSFKMKYKLSDFIINHGVYNNIICINSGMAIRLSALEMIGGFEESLFLDMIDYMLFYRLKEKELCRVLVMPKKILQSFSGRTKMSKEAARKRFMIFSKDFMRYAKLTGLSKMYTATYLMKRKMAMEIKSGK
ncbi:MAG: glycosyltransferase [Eubacterium sp.]|nr:glycosyltransferase [Eubacterium sp.]